jgi:hypothetical protein
MQTTPYVSEFTARYINLTQSEIIDERVVAAGALSRAGAMGNTMLAQFSGIASRIINVSNKRTSGGLPQNVVVAVTPTRVMFYGYKVKGAAPVLTGLALTLLRSNVRATATQGKLATRVDFHLADGTTFALDSNCGTGQYRSLNDGLLLALGASV